MFVSATGKAKSATRFGLKVQRRIVIAQALWWPTLILGGIAAGATVLTAARRRAAPQPVSVPQPITGAY
ncbi:hypothetical protein TS71_09720 [Mycolicibacterium neoaurum]|uniref:Uncharacterized protein n=1 Tax=Mycolicibacterium neoaurum VKM Ac-1815D TaxID=700508 RepID=V5XJB0_MYCNE|nr:hypothetical protein D174_09220 [Mycolicibacterium neoaurum VKM Ac-1815D]AMO05301.1 hypothetical protein MyAD_09045 [Mycolicibacterium neoaurum]AXK76386.1 hypothetical protein DXK33_16010 [Mycolicibacterium neoaurum]KJQ50846.1 hypothetical protein TS71_09720 [Mycolicibacterium neoaurum]KUM10048.1 hypothetical protein AVZ31_04250 [Mycolicibacterium neoaurum]